MWERTALWALLSFLLTACSGSDSDHASDLDFELLSYSSGAIPSIKGSSFGVCLSPGAPGSVRSAALQSARTWLSALRSRVGGGVTTSVVASCPGHVRVSYEPSVDRNHAYPRRYPHIFVGDKNMHRIQQSMLHEFGHAFGLGDTYVEGVWSCKPGQPISVMCKANSTSLTADDINGIVASYRRVFGSSTVQTNTAATGGTSIYQRPTPRPRPRPTVRPQIGSSGFTRLLGCNRDYATIRTSSRSGVCHNASSGFCYRYSGGQIHYNLGQVSCGSGLPPQQATTFATPRPQRTPLPYGTPQPAQTGRLLGCNYDYTRIRTQRLSGICLNHSSGFCYRYSNGTILYDYGSVACQM